ncbi:hypothetical protein CKAH01_13674 [Colletotrichum kahawae]|uniref:Uncharacterized protein n=1 Tax=Colletotrichum kahawae TaxID=34407 RepID=A0AAD9YME5_COLKA|nr:hypothetical protein CKAH01_13674 [Colletotrichum kahawae]
MLSSLHCLVEAMDQSRRQSQVKT